MILSQKAYRAKLVYLFALFLTLLLPLATLADCGQAAPPLYESLNLGIPAAALQSPVKGPLPDTTVNACAILRPNNFDHPFVLSFSVKNHLAPSGPERQHWCANPV